MTRVAINGFGRIGRAFLRVVQGSDIDVVAINDLANTEELAYLLKYDSVYGRFPHEVRTDDKALVVNGTSIPVLQERDPAALPWGDMDIEVVIEATGAFTDPNKASAHLSAGAKRVIITAPMKGELENAATVLVGANEERLATCSITSNASCTTNAANPLIGILEAAVGIERAILNTVHGYTSSQALVDGPSSKDPRRGRAAAVNIVPSTTGAAIATARAYTNLTDKFDGIALRVPVVSGSIVDITFVAARETSAEEVNDALRAGASDPRWSDIFTVTEDPLVSTDILAEPYGAIADLAMTRVVDGTLVKVLAWYDNELGYAATLMHHVRRAQKHGG